MPITDREMQAKPASKDQWLSESLGRGNGVFMGRITPAGERLFYFRYTAPNGNRPFLTIGHYQSKGEGGLTLAEARAQALQLSKMYGEGHKDLHGHLEQQRADREAAERQQRAEAERARVEAEQAQQRAELERQRRLTVRQLFERWASVDLKPQLGADGRRQGRKDGGEYTRQQFERHVFPALGDVAALEVRKGDVMAILDQHKAAGKLRTANVLLTDLKQMFRFALHREIVDRNPLDGVEKRAVGGKETERDRILTNEEITALAEAIPAARMGARSECAVWLILSTACRVGELMGARWEHVDLEKRKWLIPAENSKNQRHHVVHLSEFSMVHFRKLWALRETDDQGQTVPWVFPNRASKGAVCVKSFGKQLTDRQRAHDGERLSRRSKATDALTLAGGHWTAHDLRRTAATLMAGMGISSDVIDECLNHMIQGRVTRVYIRDRREAEQARAFDALGAKLTEITKGQTAPSNVVELRAAA